MRMYRLYHLNESKLDSSGGIYASARSASSPRKALVVCHARQKDIHAGRPKKRSRNELQLPNNSKV
jgi:hypothetical protein